MSVNIAVVASGDVGGVAQVFAEAAGHLASRVRALRTDRDQAGGDTFRPQVATLGDLEWADGIAFGTPVGDGCPDPGLMQFIELSEPLWGSGRLYDKVVTVFTDKPEHFAPDSVLHPIYDALYHWGAVIVGPRAFELEIELERGFEARTPEPRTGHEAQLAPSRLNSAQYRATRLVRLAEVLAKERLYRERFGL